MKTTRRAATVILALIAAFTLSGISSPAARAESGRSWNPCLAITWNTYGQVPAGEAALWQAAFTKAGTWSGLTLTRVDGKANIVIRYEPYTLLDGGTGRVHTWYETDLATGKTNYTAAMVTMQTPTVKKIAKTVRVGVYLDMLGQALGLKSGAGKAAWAELGNRETC